MRKHRHHLGHRGFGCTKYHDLGLHLRVSVPQQCLRGLLWPYEARHRLTFLHRRQTSPTGNPESSRLKRALLEVAAELCRNVRARTLGLLLLLRLSGRLGSEKGCPVTFYTVTAGVTLSVQGLRSSKRAISPQGTTPGSLGCQARTALSPPAPRSLTSSALQAAAS